MSEYPAPEELSHQDLGLILNKLRLPSENFRHQLPLKAVNGPDPSCYSSLVGFQPDNALVEMTGSRAGALNMHLEHIFGYATRSTGDGILPIEERGPSVCAIHDVLKDYCTEFPSDAILKKWVIDIAKGAEAIYYTYHIPVSWFFECWGGSTTENLTDSINPICQHIYFQQTSTIRVFDC